MTSIPSKSSSLRDPFLRRYKKIPAAIAASTAAQAGHIHKEMPEEAAFSAADGIGAPSIYTFTLDFPSSPSEHSVAMYISYSGL